MLISKRLAWPIKALLVSLIATASIHFSPIAAMAASPAPAGLSWTTSISAPSTAASLSATIPNSAQVVTYPWINFSGAKVSGDSWDVSVSLSKPAGSAVTLTDNNGSVAGATNIFSGFFTSAWGTPAFDSATSSIRATLTGAYNTSAYSRMGAMTFTPDVPGNYVISLTGMENTGSGWVAVPGTAQTYSYKVFGVITATASTVHSAAFGTGVDLDGDGNIYWADYSGSRIYKTSSTTGITSVFCVNVSNGIKLSVDGGYLYLNASDAVYRIPLNNQDTTATPSLVMSQGGMLSSAAYAQSQGFVRIANRNYIAMNISHAGEIWRYPEASSIVKVTSYSSTTSAYTLVMAAGHGFATGDSIDTMGIGSLAWGHRTITAVTATSVKFSASASTTASTLTPNGQIAKTTGAPELLTTLPSAVRGMTSSQDGRYLYLAYGPGKQILKLDLQNLSAGTTVFADLTSVGYGPDDITVLDDGSMVVSSYSPGGYLWHIGADGSLLDRIYVTLNSSPVSSGYDLRVSSDGSKIYFAAQSFGFLSLSLSRNLVGSTHGTSNLAAPTSGVVVTTKQAASIYDQNAANVSTTTALLRAGVNPNGSTALARFEWSTDPAFPVGSTNTSTVYNLDGSSVISLQYQATGLSANTTYYYRIGAGSSSPTEAYGAVLSFNTSSFPGILAASYSSSPAAGGTSVQLTTQGIASAPTVRVGGVLATNVVYSSPNTVTFTTPPQGGSDIVIDTGVSAASFPFTYSSPTLSNVSPGSGSSQGGFQVTLTGSDLTGATKLEVAGVSNAFTFVSDTSITFTTPAMSAGSNAITVTTPAGTATLNLTIVAAPGTPSAPTVVVGDGQVTVTVAAPGSGGTPSQQVVTASPGGASCTVAGSAGSCTITGLTNGVSYTFSSVASNTAGSSSASSNSVSATPVVPLAAPGAPSAPTVVVGDGQVTVTVAAPGSGGTPSQQVVTASPGGASCTVSGSAGSCTITGLTNGVSYTFSSVASNTAGSSSASSNSVSATPVVPLAAPGAPSAPTVVVGDGQVTVTVAAPGSGGTPSQQVVTASPGGASCTVSGSAGSCTITGLTNGVSYTFSSVASNTAGSSSASSNSVSATPVLQVIAPVTPVPQPPVPTVPVPQPIVLVPPTVVAAYITKAPTLGKSVVSILLPETGPTTAITSVEVDIKSPDGKVIETITVPVTVTSTSIVFTVNVKYGEFAVSVASVNSAGRSTSVVSAGATIEKRTFILTHGNARISTPKLFGASSLAKLYFKAYSTVLTKQAKVALTALKKQLNGKDSPVFVTGFSAKYGSAAVGLKLARLRAQAVANYLRSIGVRNWIYYSGFGQIPSTKDSARNVTITQG